MKKLLGTAMLLAVIGNAHAAEYVIDGTGAGMHSSVNFRANHIGISALWGRFNDVSGTFSYDANDIAASSISVAIDPASLDTNHPARDTHLKSSDYMDVEKFPEAGFVSTSVMDMGDGKMHVTGNFTLHGVTKPIILEVVRTGEGESPFGDYRVGFEAQTTIDVQDYGINVVPSSQLSLFLAIEGVRQ